MGKKNLQSILLFLALIILNNSNATLIGKYTNIIEVASIRRNGKSLKSIQSEFNLKSRYKYRTPDCEGVDKLVVFKFGESYISFEKIIPSILKTIWNISSNKTIAFIPGKIVNNQISLSNSNTINKY
jgi:hypothetical protein